MAKLTTKERNKLPASDFAGPGRSYPVEDASHARNAKARASEMEHKGRMSKGTEEKIDRRADKVLDVRPAKGANRGGHHTNVVNPHSHHEKLKHG